MIIRIYVLTKYYTISATEQMKNCLLALERGAYDEALGEVVEAARLLTAVSNPELTRLELRLCVAYALALHLLKRLKELDKDPATHSRESALLSKYHHYYLFIYLYAEQSFFKNPLPTPAPIYRDYFEQKLCS